MQVILHTASAATYSASSTLSTASGTGGGLFCMRRLIELSRSLGAQLLPYMQCLWTSIRACTATCNAQCPVPAPAPLEEVAMRVREPGHSEQRTGTAH